MQLRQKKACVTHIQTLLHKPVQCKYGQFNPVSTALM